MGKKSSESPQAVDVDKLLKRKGHGRGLVLERTSLFFNEKFLRLEQVLLNPKAGDESVAFRNSMLATGKGMTKDGQQLSFTPIVGNGNCGFLTLAIGANQVLKEHYSSFDIRRILCEEVRRNRRFYEEESTKNPSHRYHMDLEDEESFEEFEQSVLKTGWDGHWLGEKWGMLEIKSIAKALGITIDVYTFDSKSRSLRSYHQEKFGPGFVGMFFSGIALKGHFDLLLKKKR